MEYQELLSRVLKGRSVNATAHALGIPQRSLDRYVKGETVPGCKAAKLIAQEAGLPLEEVIETIIRKEEEMVRPRSRSLFPRLAATAATIMMIVNLFLTPQNAEAAPRLTYSASAQAEHFILCKMIRAMFRRLRQKMMAWFPPAGAPATT